MCIVEFLKFICEHYHPDEKEFRYMFLMVLEYICNQANVKFNHVHELNYYKNVFSEVISDNNQCFTMASKVWEDLKYQCNDTAKIMFLSLLAFIDSKAYIASPISVESYCISDKFVMPEYYEMAKKKHS